MIIPCQTLADGDGDGDDAHQAHSQVKACVLCVCVRVCTRVRAWARVYVSDFACACVCVRFFLVVRVVWGGAVYVWCARGASHMCEVCKYVSVYALQVHAING